MNRGSSEGQRWQGEKQACCLFLTSHLPTVGSSSSLGSAGSSSARHLVPGACGEAPELSAPSHCCSLADPLAANLEGAVTFEAPDLPEETLMEVSEAYGEVTSMGAPF